MESTTTRTATGVAFRCSNCKAHRRVEFLRTVTRTVHELDGRLIESKFGKWEPLQPVDVVRAFGDELPRIKCAACGCGRMTGRPIEGHLNPAVKCGAKCTHAKGHVCECECGGANHGKGNVSN